MRRDKIQITLSGGVLMMLTAIALALPSLLILMREPGQMVTHHHREVTAWPPSPVLSAKPQLYFRQVGNWHKDHVGFSVRAGRIYRHISFNVFGDAAVLNIERGQKDLVFLSSHQPNRSFSSIANSCPPRDDWPAIAADAHSDWAIIQNSFRTHGLDPVLLIIPSKKRLYADYLPITVPEHLRARCKLISHSDDPVSELARRNQDTIIDATPYLEPYKTQPHFYPPENFHADGESAMRAADAVLALVYGQDVVEKSAAGFDLKRSEADLSGVVGFRRAIWLSEPQGFEKPSIHPDAEYLEQIQARIQLQIYANAHRNPSAEIQEDVLLIANSFGARVAPYISRHVGQVRVINTNRIVTPEQNTRFFQDYVFADPPDRVIFILHDESVFERRLRRYTRGL